MHIVTHYPRLLLMACSFVLAYVLYSYGYFDFLHATRGFGYVTVFAGGMLFSLGFTSPFGIAIFAEVAPDVNPFIAAPLAGLGAFLMDFAIFELMRFSAFHDEFSRLRETMIFRHIHDLLHHRHLSETIRTYLLWCLAGFVIASPLPDEIGVSLVSGITEIDAKKFGLICWGFNTLGIFAMLMISR